MILNTEALCGPAFLACLACIAITTFLLQKTPKLLHAKPIHWMAFLALGKRLPLKTAIDKAKRSSLNSLDRLASCYRSFPTSVSLVAIFVQNYKRLRSKMLGTFMQKGSLIDSSTCIQTIGHLQHLQHTKVCFSLNVTSSFLSGDPSI